MTFTKPIIATLALIIASPLAMAQDRDPSSIPGRALSSETSDRTPGERNPTPRSQVTQTQDGETSTRTPRLSDDAARDHQSGTQQSASDDTSSKDREKVMAMSMDTLRNSLKQAGFRDVRIVDATYLVHAITSDGTFVIMTVNPPSVRQASDRSTKRDQMSQAQQSNDSQ